MKQPFAKGHWYFCMPQALFNDESFRPLKGDSLWLLMWLCFQYSYNPSRPREYSNKKIADALGVHHVNVIGLRTRLEELGLLRTEKVENGYRYIVLDPSTGTPIDEPVIDNGDEGNWAEDTSFLQQGNWAAKTESPTAAPEPVSAHSSSAPNHVDSVEQLRARYEALADKSPEELEIGFQLRDCRKDAVRTAELKTKRAALEDRRRQAREQARLAYCAAMKITEQHVSETTNAD